MNDIFAGCTPQKYKYDCGVACINNILKLIEKNLVIEYKDLMKELATTSLWGTNCKKMEEFLIKSNISFTNTFTNLNILLVSSDKFYDEYTKENDYGHYVIASKIDNENYSVFDVWDGEIYTKTRTELENAMENVLVGRTKRFNQICFGLN